jgi:methylthioribose-1-phosphate isomerase
MTQPPESPELLREDPVCAMRWRAGRLELLDQRRLPAQTVWLSLAHCGEVAEAIRDMVVRGAPAIGVTAAYGFALAVRDALAAEPARWQERVRRELAALARARPTAVNLAWSLRRMEALLELPAEEASAAALAEAEAIHAEDRAGNRHIGILGAAEIGPDSVLFTHCNTGSLATGGYGTALAVVRAAWEAGKVRRIYVDETRPWWQGSRLTAWELSQNGIPATLIVDAAAAAVMREQGRGWVIVGADRIAANGDVANKIGTYALAVAAQRHGFGFMVAAPTSTIDPDTGQGDAIPIEERSGSELTRDLGWETPPAIAAFNPVFDVTPAELIDCIVTERSVCRAPFRESLGRALRERG